MKWGDDTLPVVTYIHVTIYDKIEMFHVSVTVYVGDRDANQQGRWSGSLVAQFVVVVSKYDESCTVPHAVEALCNLERNKKRTASSKNEFVCVEHLCNNNLWLLKSKKVMRTKSIITVTLWVGSSVG